MSLSPGRPRHAQPRRDLRGDRQLSAGKRGGRTLFTTASFFVLGVPAFVIGVETSPDGGETPGAPAVPLIVALVLFYLAIVVPSIAVTVRRLHDTGQSGWMFLLTLIPWVGGLILLVFTVLPPSPAGAKYDPAPTYPPGPYPPGLYQPGPYPSAH